MNGVNYNYGRDMEDDGYDSGGDLYEKGGNSSKDEDGVVQDSLSLDQQISMYDQLQLVMYPDIRLEEIIATNKKLGLQDSVFFPSPHPDKPKTTQERQWMEEHPRPLYQQVQHPESTESPPDERQTLHELYLTHRDDPKASFVSRRSTLIPGNINPMATTEFRSSHRMSLLQIAEEARDSEAGETEYSSAAKENIARMLSDETAVLPGRSSIRKCL